MFTEARKLSLIEAIIKSTDVSVLTTIEKMVSKESTDSRTGIADVKFIDLLGQLTPEEAEAMKRTIEENFEKVNLDDWQ